MADEEIVAVTEYVEDMMAFHKRTEIACNIPSYYHVGRAVLIDEVVESHNDIGFFPETLYRTVDLIDRFLAVQELDQYELELVGMSALFIAAKYEEIRDHSSKMYQLSETAYSVKQVVEMEWIILDTLKFDLWHPTPYVFMKSFLKVAQSNKKVEHMSFFIL
ncbi:G2/mitotic-specific cyclin-2-like [Salvia splendens]|uniref:G2/mitotic-specific cyclin-2-like n=1 Tax=Salvia splendens TaxID=180675 RepID=UPI001C26AA4D|nr:G2/mitotic-specific cyclin-2-like [Salvia splendens]XP_042048123.1 G2/mitotic-specific cyclin-2-like [Salvia splendens]